MPGLPLSVLYLQLPKVTLFYLNALTGVYQRHIPLVLLDLLVQLPDVGIVLGQLHAVQVSQLRDGLQLVQQPHHSVQSQLRGLSS